MQVNRPLQIYLLRKVSIVSHKVQTTRVRTLGIAIHDETQLILLDTPGIFKAKKTLEKSLVKSAWNTVKDVDALVLLVDASYHNMLSSFEILDGLKTNSPLFLVLNKIDIITKEKQEAIIDQFSKYPHIEKTFCISALTHQGTDQLKQALASKMPYSEWDYPDDILSNQPENLWAAEITREQLYLQLHEELPYETYVVPESFEYFDDGSVKISQAVVVARSSQKGIILGSKGSKIKAIGEKTRKILETEMNQRVHLKLFVKVQNDWMEKSSVRKDLGLE
jgi:GTP-binding protein Era